MSVSPKTHHFVVLATLFVINGAAHADEQSPLEQVYACADIKTDSERLACFDAAVASTRTAQESGEFATITREEAEEVQRDAFGFTMPSIPKLAMPKFGNGRSDGVKTDGDGQISELELAITSIREDAYGKVMITFENGQVWLQTDSEKVRISKKRPPESAVVKRASLGSFLIRLNTGERFKAKRVE